MYNCASHHSSTSLSQLKMKTILFFFVLAFYPQKDKMNSTIPKCWIADNTNSLILVRREKTDHHNFYYRLGISVRVNPKQSAFFLFFFFIYEMCFHMWKKDSLFHIHIHTLMGWITKIWWFSDFTSGTTIISTFIIVILAVQIYNIKSSPF